MATTEEEVIQESFACLRGYPGEFYTTPATIDEERPRLYFSLPEKRSWSVAAPRFVPNKDIRLAHCTVEALRHSMMFVAELAGTLESLRNFSTVHSKGEPTQGVVWQAFAHAISLFVLDVEGRLIVLERSFKDTADEPNGSQPTILKLLGRLQPIYKSVDYVYTFVDFLRRAIDKGQETNAKWYAERTLSCLYHKLEEATLLHENEGWNHVDGVKHKPLPLCRVDGASQEKCFNKTETLSGLNIMLFIFVTTIRPFVEIIDAWLQTGLLTDAQGDFFVSRNRRTVAGERGAGRAARGTFSPLPKSQTVLVSRRQFPGDDSSTTMDASFWDEEYSFEEQYVPTFLKSVGRLVHVAGKAVAIKRTISPEIISEKFTQRSSIAPSVKIFETFASYMSLFLPLPILPSALSETTRHFAHGRSSSEAFFKGETATNEQFFSDEGPLFHPRQVQDSEEDMVATLHLGYLEEGNKDHGAFLNRNAAYYMSDQARLEKIPHHSLYLARGDGDGDSRLLVEEKNSAPRPGEDEPTFECPAKNKLHLGAFENPSSVLIGGAWIPLLQEQHTRTTEAYLGTFDIRRTIKAALLLPIRNQCFQENKLFVELLRSDLNLPAVLDSLRMCFFFSDVEVMEPFLLMLFEQISNSATEWLRMLTPFLQQTLANHPSSKTCLEPGRWSASFFVQDDEEYGSGRPNDQTAYDGIGVLDHLKLNYSASWPLNIVIGSESLELYNLIMRSLMQVKRAKHQLDHLHHEMRYQINILEKEANLHSYFLPRDADFRSHAHTYMLLIGELMHFVNNLHNYLMERCVYGEWDNMLEAIMKATTVTELRAFHLGYLMRLRDQCLLHPQGKVVSLQIRKILNISLQCVGAIRQWYRLGSQRVEWDGDQVHRTDKVPHSQMLDAESKALAQALIHLEDLQQKYDKTNKFLHILLRSQQKRADASVQHITEVLLRLDFNCFYFNSK